MNRLLFGLLAVLAAGSGLLVGTLNSDRVTLDLLWVQLHWPLGLLLLIALASGILLGLLISYFAQVLPLRMKLRKQKAEAARAERQVMTGTDD
jgi:uncharacterized integral membrane protein